MGDIRPAVEVLPEILAPRAPAFLADARERELLQTARRLFDGGFYGHALIDLWNASVHNLRRRVEAYGVDLFESVVKDEAGRKRWARDGDTLQERWAGVDDLVLIVGATRLGLLTKKAGKALEMINWMRSHASAAHDTADEVGPHDVVALGLMLETNLFRNPLPDPGHSVAALFGPIKAHPAGPAEIRVFEEQVQALRPPDLRVCFGFLLDLVSRGIEPGLSNARALFAEVWALAPEDLRKTAGVRYHTLTVAPDERRRTAASVAGRMPLLSRRPLSGQRHRGTMRPQGRRPHH